VAILYEISTPGSSYTRYSSIPNSVDMGLCSLIANLIGYLSLPRGGRSSGSKFFQGHIVCGGIDTDFRIRFAFPRSSSTLTDLDQAAALGAAIFGAAYVFLSRSRTICRVSKRYLRAFSRLLFQGDGELGRGTSTA
jgi:hypothetical protein